MILLLKSAPSITFILPKIPFNEPCNGLQEPPWKTTMSLSRTLKNLQKRIQKLCTPTKELQTHVDPLSVLAENPKSQSWFPFSFLTAPV